MASWEWGVVINDLSDNRHVKTHDDYQYGREHAQSCGVVQPHQCNRVFCLYDDCLFSVQLTFSGQSHNMFT